MLQPLLLLLPWSGAWAQGEGAAAVAQAPYVDRVIDPLLLDASEADDVVAFDRSGWPRYLRLDARLGSQPFERQRSAHFGLDVDGVLETPNYGVLSLAGSLNPRTRGSTVTLRQRDMPFDGGWRAHHALGVINPPLVALLRLPARVFVPYTLQRGLSTEWENLGRGLRLSASAGRPGRLDPLPQADFRPLAGRRVTFGVQGRLGGPPADPLMGAGWTAALQHESGYGVRATGAPITHGALVDAHSTLLALRHEGARHRIQMQTMRTRSSGLARARAGWWADAEREADAITYGAGAYRLEPRLSWAQLPMASDVAGVYCAPAGVRASGRPKARSTGSSRSAGAWPTAFLSPARGVGA